MDEWHELMASKRGVQTELCLARLRRFRPGLRTLGLSATLGQSRYRARRAARRGRRRARRGRAGSSRGSCPRRCEVDALIPETMERFPWSGQIGLRLLPEVVAAIEEGETALVFTNTRATAEIWFQAMLAARPDWAGIIALHHGSMDREHPRVGGGRTPRRQAPLRRVHLDARPRRGLHAGGPRAPGREPQGRRPADPARRPERPPAGRREPADLRAHQRAGAGGRGRGARRRSRPRAIEARRPVERPLDLLAQHAVTVALGGGFRADELLRRGAHHLGLPRPHARPSGAGCSTSSPAAGARCESYPEYSKVVEQRRALRGAGAGWPRMRHRLSIGTIVSEAAMKVQLLRGRTLGTVEENFIARLRPGDVFTFAGRTLEFVRVRGMVAYVRKSTRRARPSCRTGPARGCRSRPSWPPAIRIKLDEARQGVYQRARDGGGAPHPGAAGPLVAHPRRGRAADRAGRDPRRPPPLLLSDRGATGARGARRALRLPHRPARPDLLHPGGQRLRPRAAVARARADSRRRSRPGSSRREHLLHDIPASLNAAELARRQFREIARVAGLVFQGYPGRQGREAGAGLERADLRRLRPLRPGNLLLFQAHREVLERQLEQSRLAAPWSASRAVG